VRVFANVASAEDVREARKAECDGIGLYRTEALYMIAHELPEEDSLVKSLSSALSGFPHLPVVLRLADIGGDKTLPYLNIGREHASHLGVRGVRFLLRFPELLRTQLRVFYRLGASRPIRILVPFVSGATDMLQVKDVAREARASLHRDKLPCGETVEFGAMIETPLAAMAVDEILHHADFVSVGTNDLIQYVAAADRESLAVSGYFREGVGPSLSLLQGIVRRCDAAGKECTLCGELAGDPEYTEKLLELGLVHFSVLPSFIGEVREKIRRIVDGTESRRDLCVKGAASPAARPKEDVHG